MQAEDELSEQHRAVRAWLATLYGAAPVPPYELTAANLARLVALQGAAQAADAAARAVADDARAKAAEYRAEG